MDEIASQITSLKIIYSAVYLDADQRKHQFTLGYIYCILYYMGLLYFDPQRRLLSVKCI